MKKEFTSKMYRKDLYEYFFRISCQYVRVYTSMSSHLIIDSNVRKSCQKLSKPILNFVNIIKLVLESVGPSLWVQWKIWAQVLTWKIMESLLLTLDRLFRWAKVMDGGVVVMLMAFLEDINIHPSPIPPVFTFRLWIWDPVPWFWT